MSEREEKSVTKVTKAELVDRIWNSGEFFGRKSELVRIVDTLLFEIKEALASGSVIELRGLGTFEVKVRKGRQCARNPRTGETVSVENHGVAVFRPGKELKNRVWDLRK